MAFVSYDVSAGVATGLRRCYAVVEALDVNFPCSIAVLLIERPCGISNDNSEAALSTSCSTIKATPLAEDINRFMKALHTVFVHEQTTVNCQFLQCTKYFQYIKLRLYSILKYAKSTSIAIEWLQRLKLLLDIKKSQA